MKTTTKLISLCTTLLLAFSPQPLAFAQGTAFSYQGRLNVGGTPANGSYDLTFALFDSAGGGTQQGATITATATAVSNGLFTLTLDFGNQFPGPNRWLEVGARTNGAGAFATLSPRQQITSTPYSIQAANASIAASANSVAAGNISGTLTTAQLPSAVLTNGASGVSISGAFTGNGSGLTNVPGTMAWQTVAGTSVTAAANQGYLLTNSSASTVTLPTTANAGDIVTVSGEGSSGWQVLTTAGQMIVQNSATIWTNNNNSPAANWFSVASSADGTKLVAVMRGGQIYTSSDSGVTWSANTNAPSTLWSSVASSADGTKLAAVSGSGVVAGQIYTSVDSGSHWSAAATAPTTNWASIASSADGTKLVAVGGIPSGGFIYTSTNSGATWTPSITGQTLNSEWSSVASSADGTKLVALLDVLLPSGGAIYTSTDSGVSWVRVYNTSAFSGPSVASSSDGTKLVSAFGGQITSSANSGATWSINGNLSSVGSIASSADGTKLVAVANGGRIYTSTDSGVTWLSNNAPATNWQAVASSADGTRLVAAVSGGQIWTSLAGFGTAFAGAPGATTQFQYLGNGVWQPVGQSAGQLVGTLPTATLPANVVTNTESGVTLSGTFSGNGAGLTSLNASQLTSGTVPGAALSGTYGNALSFTNPGNTFSGNGAGLTSLNASQLASGTVADARLSTNVALRAGGNSFTGTQTVTSGRVGIGTNNPGAELTVVGDGASVQLQAVTPGYSCYQAFWNSAGTVEGLIGVDGFGFGNFGNQMLLGTWSAHPLEFVTAATQRMTIDSTGNVGIGTTTPLVPLSFANTLGDKISLYASSPTNNYGFGVQSFQLQIHTDTSQADIVFGSGQSANLTETMRIKGNGNVGIGTSNPGANNLQINPAYESANGYGLVVCRADYGENIQINRTNGQGGIALVVDDAAAGDSSTSMLLIRNNVATSAHTLLNVLANGNVGIGTATPTKAPLEIDTQQSESTPAGYYFNTSGGFTSFAAGNQSVSIWAAGYISSALGFLAASDQRIKNIQGQSDSAADLNTLLGIKVTDFIYKDTVAKGNRPQKKVIAQQVERVYPQAVSQSTDVVPDIYQKATLKEGWVQLATDLKVGDRVKLISENEKGVYPVLEVHDRAFRTDFKPSSDQVFVYGREVMDFRTVDYEAIAMLNVSATQELANKVTRLEGSLNQVLSEKEALLKRLSVLEACVQAREDRMARMERALEKDSATDSYASFK